MSDYAELKEAAEMATPGPWQAFNMVGLDGKPMTAEQIGLYVKNSILKSIESGGATDRFLFVGQDGKGRPDVCHVGNGPNGPHNARFIALCREAVPALIAERERLREDLRLAIMSDSDEVKALEADNAKLREALKPFADEAAQYDVNDDDRIRDDEEMTNGSDFSVGELRRARAAIGDAT